MLYIFISILKNYVNTEQLTKHIITIQPLNKTQYGLWGGREDTDE